MKVGKGETVCIIGANGAGKTTTLLTISGILKPSAGSIIFQGTQIAGMSADRIVSLGISHVPEGRHIFPRLTVLENLNLGGFIKGGATKDDIERICAMFPVLKDRLGQKGGTLSGGEQQMLAIARALISRPKLMLMDEPSLGLAPKFVEKVFSIVEEIGREGTTMLIVEQNAHLAMEVSDRCYVMETGTIALEGPSRELMKDERIRTAYLGE
jgi:branched-chain amino acid transport system ATP-binding protein